MRKTRSSEKIAIGFVAIVAVGYFGWGFVSDKLANAKHYDAVVPGTINLVGLDPGIGYQIVVANQVAQLVKRDKDFNSHDSGGADAGATSGSIKSRIPIADMIGSLRGDPKAIGAFVMRMNSIIENDEWPSQHIVWKAEDIQKALDGDATLAPKLEHDLNMKLDGMPLAKFSVASVSNGIIVDQPVTLKVSMNGKPTLKTGRVEQPYKPHFIRDVEKRFEGNAKLTPTVMAGYYTEEAHKLMDRPQAREDIRKTLGEMVSKASADRLAEEPERVLRSAFVIVNEKQITKASYQKYLTGDGKTMCDLSIDLDDEGRMRLWQYSHDRVGTQILLVADGVAIAAPRILQELRQGELRITQMPDEVLVRDAVETIEHSGRDKK